MRSAATRKSVVLAAVAGLCVAMIACSGESSPGAAATAEASTAGSTADRSSTATRAGGATSAGDAVVAKKKKVKRWRPKKGLTWQWQLSGRVDTSVPAQVYDIDYQSPSSVVRTLHADGRRVICYLSAGSWEEYRSDAGRFPRRLLGNELDGWPDERWLDIRKRKALKKIMAKRMNECARKGFDGVEPDNVDGYQNRTGFPLRAVHQRKYNRMLARMAHKRGLAIGLKNDLDQVRVLQKHFDFAVNEQCAEYRECDLLRPFLKANKPVFHAEYELTTDEFCPTSRRLGLSSLLKRWDLDAWRQTC